MQDVNRRLKTVQFAPNSKIERDARLRRAESACSRLLERGDAPTPIMDGSPDWYADRKTVLAEYWEAYEEASGIA